MHLGPGRVLQFRSDDVAGGLLAERRGFHIVDPMLHQRLRNASIEASTRLKSSSVMPLPLGRQMP